MRNSALKRNSFKFFVTWLRSYWKGKLPILLPEPTFCNTSFSPRVPLTPSRALICICRNLISEQPLPRDSFSPSSRRLDVNNISDKKYRIRFTCCVIRHSLRKKLTVLSNYNNVCLLHHSVRHRLLKEGGDEAGKGRQESGEKEGEPGFCFDKTVCLFLS